MWIDSHTHIYLDAFQEDRSKTIETAIEKGVNRFYLPAIDSSYMDDMLRLEKQYPQEIQLMTGLHPCSVNENYKQELMFVKKQLDSREFAAIGEIGLDLYWEKKYIEQQKKAFVMQCEWALEYQLPIVIHVREAYEEILQLMKQFENTSLRAVFHCFSSDEAHLNAILELGHILGIGGVVTFKNSRLAQTLLSYGKGILDHLLLETDAPYLTPHPHRGTRNEPSYIPLIGKKLAETFDLSEKVIAQKTTDNCLHFFKNYS